MAENSLSNIVDNLIKLQRNNTEVLLKLSEVISSTSDTVTFDIVDTDTDTIKKITVPSINAMKADFNRIDENVKQMAGLNDNPASIKLNDGNYRTIIKSSLNVAPNDLTNIDVPSTFSNKNNWFFESFINPYLFVTYDFNGQIESNCKQVKSSRFILILDDDAKINHFNNNYKGNSNIDYFDFIDDLNSNGINFYLDEDVIDLPVIDVRYWGDFLVEKVIEGSNPDGTKSLKFQLDSIFYNDKTTKLRLTRELKTGDSLLVNKGDKNTRYEITQVDSSTNQVSVKLIEGYDGVRIGTKLSYYSTDKVAPTVQIGIGFNEYIVQFVKPIDPTSGIASVNWSPGTGFWSNELTISDNGTIKTLDTYYKESVVDFGAYLLSFAKENIPPSSKGIKPNRPSLSSTTNPEELKVVQINKHATDTQSNSDIEKLNKDKNTLKTQLTQLDESIKKLRYEISTKSYKNDTDKSNDKTKLYSLIDERSSVETLYTTTINDIITKANDKNTSAASAKYRIRGFINIPESKQAIDGTTQEIIQFEYEYRYLTKGGSANNIEEFKRVDESGNELKGVYSNWEKVKTPLRERLYDSSTGNYYWAPQNTEDSESININQLDIPIQPNESVEIRIKSISEAGYPSNPLYSDWSDVITVDFPESLGISKDILSIVKEANDEKVNLKLQQDLEAKGINAHIADQFTQNDSFYAHQSFNIASGFLTTERNVISLFDVIKQMQDKINELEAKVNKTVGELIVKIEDDLGNQQIIKENTVVNIFAGNYKDIVSNLEKPKGEIVSKNYFIRIENSAATPIELFSIDFGSKLVKSNQYTDSYIGLTNPDLDDLTNTLGPGITAKNLPYASAQVKGQFVYTRKYDTTGTKELHSADSSLGDGGTLSSSHTYFNASDINAIGNANYASNSDYFVWYGDETIDNVTTPGSGTINGIQGINIPNSGTYIHCEHPILQKGLSSADINSFIEEYSSSSIYSSLEKELNPTKYYRQCPYYTNGSNSTKIAFREEDKYLIGPNTCGSYLYLAPQVYNDIRVNGNDSTSIKSLEYSSSKGVAIQLVYQFRMTDYYGPGSTGIGRIGGAAGINQLNYAKMIGIDIYYDEKKFSFDVEISARYKSNSISASDIPTLVFQNTTSGLNNTVSQITPNL